MWAAGTAGGVYLMATHADTGVVDFVGSHPWAVWFVGPLFAAVTGVGVKVHAWPAVPAKACCGHVVRLSPWPAVPAKACCGHPVCLSPWPAVPVQDCSRHPLARESRCVLMLTPLRCPICQRRGLQQHLTAAILPPRHPAQPNADSARLGQDHSHLATARFRRRACAMVSSSAPR